MSAAYPWRCHWDTTGLLLAGRPHADDFVVLTDGIRDDAEALREEVAGVLAGLGLGLGLPLSPAKTRIMHMSAGFSFLGFRIQWKRKGTPANGTSAPSLTTGPSGR